MISPPRESNSPEKHTNNLFIAKAVQLRHSVRAFKPDPIPAGTLEECFSLAQHAPSSSNVQPWRLTVISGAALKRLSEALLAANNDPDQQDQISPIPAAYKHYRSELGHQMYGEGGYKVSREDKEGHMRAVNRNYSFFDAPTALILSIDQELANWDILTTGLYLQTLLLLLQERGVSNCIDVSVVGYPDTIRKELGISSHMRLLCGVAIGYEDASQHINVLKPSRDEWTKSVTFVTD